MTSSYFQGSSDGSSNAEMAPDTGCHFMHLWCSVTDRFKALANKPVGSPSKETPAPSKKTPAPAPSLLSPLLYDLLQESRHSRTDYLFDGFTFKQ